MRILLVFVCLAVASIAGATPTIGEPAPPISVSEAFRAPDGASVDLESLRGDVVVLEFWATWCGPCVAAIPHLNELADEFAGEDVRFISITKEDRATVERFMKKREMKSWVVRDEDGATNAAYGVRGIPSTFIINAEGVLVADTHPTHVKAEHIRTAIAGGTPDFGISHSMRTGELTQDDELAAADFRFTIEKVDAAVGRMAIGMNAVTLEGVSALRAMQQAFGVDPHRVEGGEHLPEGFFTIVGKAPVRGTSQFWDLTIPALETTFGVRTRWEPRTVPALRLEKTVRAAELLTSIEDPLEYRTSLGSCEIGIDGTNLGVLASLLETAMGLPVSDHSGLEGRYRVTIGIDKSLSGGPDDARLSAWREAVREQAGLRLVDEYAEIKVLIIEPRD